MSTGPVRQSCATLIISTASVFARGTVGIRGSREGRIDSRNEISRLGRGRNVAKRGLSGHDDWLRSA